METKLKEKEELVPELTLDDEAPKLNYMVGDAKETIAETVKDIPEQKFTEAEQRQIDDFVKQIDLNNMDQIMKYGASAQKKSANFSEAALKGVQTKDFGEIGSLLANLTTEVRGFGETDKKGILGLFQKGRNKVEAMKVKYSETETNINKISKALETHQFTLLKDASMLDKLYDENLIYFKELSMYIAAGEKKLAQVRQTELAELQNKAEATGLPEDAQAAKDLAEKCERFEKKLTDLKLTRTISLQNGPQIRLIQNADMMMSDKIQSTINNTIPLWKNQMVLALGVSHAEEAAKAQKLVSDATNEMLKKNADLLKQATVDTAKENERTIVDIETLQHTNDQLISTITEVIQIQEDGAKRRKEAEAELTRIEGELKNKLLEASGRKPQ
ncbi:MAG: toxic anion resistance protein [Eubacterium sp.]|nr:toxic anion resistance protein [Eubacterium sp.]